jgi:hypothetical protein
MVDRQARASARSKSSGTCCGMRVSSGGNSFDLYDLLKPMAKIANLGDVNIAFKPVLPP